LATLSADEFKDIVIQKLQNKPVVVIFAEESVSLYNVCAHTVTCHYRTLDTKYLLKITFIVVKLVKLIRLFHITMSYTCTISAGI
jgi:hypothetical protein